MLGETPTRKYRIVITALNHQQSSHVQLRVLSLWQGATLCNVFCDVKTRKLSEHGSGYQREESREIKVESGLERLEYLISRLYITWTKCMCDIDCVE